jgi:predicted transcriptional regulator
MLRDSNNASYDFADGSFWGYQIREFTYDSLDIIAYYELSGVIRNFIISIHDPLKLPANQTEKETAIYVANKLSIPILTNSTDSPKVFNFGSGYGNATALVFSQSLNGFPLTGLNLTIFWFNGTGVLRQIQSYAYFDLQFPSLSSTDALLIGRNETLGIAGYSNFINESIIGLRLAPVFEREGLGNNMTYNPISKLTLCYEYVAYIMNTTADSPQGILLLIDSQNGSIRWIQMESLPVSDHSIAFPLSTILVLLIPVLFIGAVLSFVFVPLASFGFAAILSVLAIWAKGPKMLENFNRGRIIGYITARPGCSYSELKDALGIVNGPLSYHLAILEKIEIIRSEKDGRKRRYYCTGIAVQSPTSTYLGMTEAKVLSEIERLGLSSNSEVAGRLDMSRQRVLYNIKLLAERGLIEEEDSRWKVVKSKE